MSQSIARLLAAVIASSAIATPVASLAQDAEGATGAPSARLEPTSTAAPAAASAPTPDPAAPPAEPAAPDDDWASRRVGLPSTGEAPRETFEYLPSQRPISVREYDVLRRELRAGRDDARRKGADDEVDAYSRELELLDAWIEEDTAMRSAGATAGGVVLISLGGTSAVLGVAAVGTGLGEAGILGGAFLLGGAGLLAVGIPLTAWGSGRVMMDDVTSNASGAAVPTGRVLLVPGGARVEGSF